MSPPIARKPAENLAQAITALCTLQETDKYGDSGCSWSNSGKVLVLASPPPPPASSPPSFQGRPSALTLCRVLRLGPWTPPHSRGEQLQKHNRRAAGHWPPELRMSFGRSPSH